MASLVFSFTCVRRLVRHVHVGWLHRRLGFSPRSFFFVFIRFCFADFVLVPRRFVSIVFRYVFPPPFPSMLRWMCRRTFRFLLMGAAIVAAPTPRLNPTPPLSFPLDPCRSLSNPLDPPPSLSVPLTNPLFSRPLTNQLHPSRTLPFHTTVCFSPVLACKGMRGNATRPMGSKCLLCDCTRCTVCGATPPPMRRTTTSRGQNEDNEKNSTSLGSMLPTHPRNPFDVP